MKKLIAFILLSVTIGILFAESNQPPFDTKNPAIDDNFRAIYYNADQIQSGISYLTNNTTGQILTGNGNSVTPYWSSTRFWQVMKSTTTGQYQTTGTSFVNTPLTATITARSPSGTSTADITVTFYSETTNGGSCFFTLAKGATNLGLSNGFVRTTNAIGAELDMNQTLVWTDPSLGSGTTSYTLQIMSGGGNTCRSGANNHQNVMKIMEVDP